MTIRVSVEKRGFLAACELMLMLSRARGGAGRSQVKTNEKWNVHDKIEDKILQCYLQKQKKSKGVVKDWHPVISWSEVIWD